MGMRGRLPLLAVLLLAACTGTPAPPVPSSPPASTAASTSIEAALLARPLRLPRVAPGRPCPTSRATARTPVAQEADTNGLGTGPLYPIAFYIGNNATLNLGQETPGPDGLYEMKVVWASSGAYRGPAVVRVGRIDGPGRGYVRLYYYPDASRGDAVVFPPESVPADFPSGTWVSGPGCYAYQVDGPEGTEIIVFRVVR
jgi:hypothetical protein